MIAYFLSNISAKYYKNPSMICRVIAKNVGDVFLRHSVYAIAMGQIINYAAAVLSETSRPIVFSPATCLCVCLQSKLKKTTTDLCVTR